MKAPKKTAKILQISTSPKTHTLNFPSLSTCSPVITPENITPTIEFKNPTISNCKSLSLDMEGEDSLTLEHLLESSTLGNFRTDKCTMTDSLDKLIQDNENLRAENSNLKKIIDSKEIANADVLLFEMRKKLRNKDLLIQELQAQIQELCGKMQLSEDTANMSIASEIDSSAIQVNCVRSIGARPSKVLDITRIDDNNYAVQAFQATRKYLNY